MCKKTLSMMLIVTLICLAAQRPLWAQSAALSPKEQQKIEELKKKIVEWGTNKMVSIELKSKARTEGRIQEIRDDSLSLQYVEQGQVKSQDVNYADIKKISLKGEYAPGRMLGKGLLYGLAGLGALMLTMIIIFSTTEDS